MWIHHTGINGRVTESHINLYEKGVNMRYLKPLFILVIILGVYSVNGASGQEKAYKAVTGNDGIQRIEIVGGGYYFDPNHIIVVVNVPVELEVKKKAKFLVPHNIVIKAPEAGIDFNESLSKEPKIIRFTPVKTGKYIFYCDKKLLFFKSHRDKGMEGVLEVIK
jgi:plastocyanin domain-containing protein